VALISVFYVLGYLHGMRYGASKMGGGAYADRESEKMLIEALPSEVSAIRFGADTEPAVEKIRALLLASKEKDGQPKQPRRGRTRPRTGSTRNSV